MFDIGEAGRLLLTVTPLSRILYVVAVMAWSALAFSLFPAQPPLPSAMLLCIRRAVRKTLTSRCLYWREIPFLSLSPPYRCVAGGSYVAGLRLEEILGNAANSSGCCHLFSCVCLPKQLEMVVLKMKAHPPGPLPLGDPTTVAAAWHSEYYLVVHTLSWRSSESRP